MRKKVVLFGAGVYAKKYKSFLEYVHMTFDFFTDNDNGKVGKYLYDKEIISPLSLIDMDCNIIISCTHAEQIKKQLEEMGILNKVLEIQDIYKEYTDFMNKGNIDDCLNDRTTVIIDMYEGIGWGGTEMWAAGTAQDLSEKGHTVILFGSDQQACLDGQKEEMVQRFSEIDTIEEMTNKIRDNLPCVIINNFAGCVLLAAVLVKLQNPKSVQIISVVHSDNINLYDAHMMFREWTDVFFCVSRQIRETIIEKYALNRNQVFYKEPHIESEEPLDKHYSKGEEPLRIGYASRLVKQLKRVDLFPQLIILMEEKGINYQMEIAGEGECFELIDRFISDKGLHNKIRLLGRVPKQNMCEFWKRQDVFINISECEGTSLAMLEAMAFGCVPVVTRVSGVTEYIKKNQNGFIREVGDLEGIAEDIKKIDSVRDILPQYGKSCYSEIQKRCGKTDYVNYIEKIMTIK